MEENCQAPQAPILCVNNCGFFGAAATMNMCSKCYKDFVVKQQQEELAVSSIQSIVNGTSSSAAVTLVTQMAPTSSIVTPTPQTSAIEEVKQGPTRCGTCKKRVGLTGFNCRCGNTFCAIHRYSDKHECSFDYRTEAQEAIAKANPVVKADKLDKI